MGDVEFRILGPVEVYEGDRRVQINAPREQVILAALLLAANRIVSLDRLIGAVWGVDPPPTARGQIQICISALRRSLGDRDLIATQGSGYLLHVAENQLDLTLFDRLLVDGRMAAAAGNLKEAEEKFTCALQLWRGPALAGITGLFAEAAAARLEERRLMPVEERLEVRLKLGRHRELIDELVWLVDEHPLRERLRGFLMVALYRSDRQAEALMAYRAARRELIEELGLEPGEMLRGLERAILSHDPSLNLWAQAAPSVTALRPQQLPADVADFVGRTEFVDQLRCALAGPLARSPGGRTVPVTVITGIGGMGKTALAIHVAHILRDVYSNGQLFARLHGSEQRPVSPAETLGRFLRAFGVLEAAVPRTIDERAELYRSQLARSRVLVVLDDAGSESQVLPLLPGHPGCAVIVTSRSRLAGLPGAQLLEVKEFTPECAVALLTKIVGSDRVAVDPVGTARLAALCGGLPLAMRVAGAKLAARPHWPISGFVERLEDERRRLDEFAYGDVDVRASLSVTYHALSAEAQRLFRWLGLLEMPGFAAWTAGALLDCRLATGLLIIDELVEARLLDIEHQPDHPWITYRLHNLVRVFARDQLMAEESEAARTAVLTRILGGYVAMAQEAHRRVYGGDFTVLHGNATRWYPPGGTDQLRLLDDPFAWFDCERPALLAAVSQAADAGLDELCWDMAVTLVTFFEARGHTDDWRRTHEQALAATRRAGNRRGEAAVLSSLGSLSISQRIEDGMRMVSTALGIFAELGDDLGQSLALRNLAHFHRREGRLDEAISTYENALKGFQRIGDEIAEAHVLSGLAQAHLDRGDVSRAESLARESLAISCKLSNQRVEAQALHRIGEVLLRKQQLPAAAAAFTDALAIARQVGDRVGQAYAHTGLGLVHFQQRSYTEAESCLTDALTLGRETGDIHAQACTLLALGRIYAAQGESERAQQNLIQAASMFGAQNSPLWHARALDVLTEVYSAASRGLGQGPLARFGTVTVADSMP